MIGANDPSGRSSGSAVSRRTFITSTIAFSLSGCTTSPRPISRNVAREPIIDIHQHTHYSGRSDADLIQHQRTLGITTTVLLPAGRYYGLEAQCDGNQSVQNLAKKHPRELLFFANELPYLKEAEAVIRQNLNQGAIGIGEQKFRILADSAYLDRIARIARDYHVPILLHFWDGDFNMEMERFQKVLEKFPTVNFIGHAQTWWGHIDKNFNRRDLYPKGKVIPGGLTDRWLADYPNLFGDLSAGSGLNALRRDPDFTASFLQRHQDKLLFGSDCSDKEGRGPACLGSEILTAVRHHAQNKAVERKILFENARQLLKLPAEQI